MLKRAGIILGVLLAGSTLLTGCGVGLTELTESEREQIVSYSAHVVSEFNSRQTKGYIALSKETLETLTQDKEPEEQNLTEENEVGNATGETGGSETGDNNAGQTTLSQALGVSGIVVENLTYEAVAEYGQGTIFSMSPNEGNCFMALKCVVKNTLTEEIVCDIYGKRLEFVIDINNGANQASSLVTILDNDLSTMSETLAAGGSKEVVLLFEIPQTVADSIDTMTLNVKNGSTNHSILMK